MTAILLALAFNDAALGAADLRDFRLRDGPLTTTDATIKVRAWTIEPRKVLDDLKAGRIKSAKDLSWQLLASSRRACRGRQ